MLNKKFASKEAFEKWVVDGMKWNKNYLYYSMKDDKTYTYKPEYFNPLASYLDETKVGLWAVKVPEGTSYPYPYAIGDNLKMWFDKTLGETMFTQVLSGEVIYSMKQILEDSNKLIMFTNLNNNIPLVFSITSNLEGEIETGGTWTLTYKIYDSYTSENFDLFTYTLSSLTGSLVSTFTWGSDARVADFTDIKVCYKGESYQDDDLVEYNSNTHTAE